ncbi:hypothetical protein [Sphaerisporangium dianthi]|uniref:Streptogrisin C n=1 Tax=Sphaerisporangium dianthi TaxID=1436120 RepID=A0ABV9CHV9_9ACTN
MAFGAALLTVGMGVAPAAAAPDPVKDTRTQSIEPTGKVPGGFASWKDLLAAQEKLTRAADRITEAVAQNSGGYAGVIAAPESRELRVYWKGKPSKAFNDLLGLLRRDVAISVLPAQYTARELEGEANRLIRANSSVLTSIAPLQDGSGLKASTAVLGAARSAISGAKVPVTLEYGVKPELSTRWNDSPPWWGGGAWANATTGGGCSTGFAVTYGGAQKILSAGHCGDVGHTATDPTGQVIGSVTQDNNSRDVLLIGASAGGRVFNNPVGSVATEYSNAVVGTTGSTVGMFICTSGAYSGTNCNIKVTAVNVTINVGYLINGTVQAEQQAHTNAVGQGDSGGSVEVVNPANTNTVYAAGVNTAIDGSTSVACTGYVTSGRICAWRMYYAPWSNATTAFPGIAIILG